ncbi:MAG: DUF4158 domain-containing protein [bacterium]|nr:DUF4158 domain-containing protein [bacterium]
MAEHVNLELIENKWILSFEELAILKGKSGDNHLGFITQIKFFQSYGRFPKSKKEVSSHALTCLANQLETPISDWVSYNLDGRTAKRHRTEALSFLELRRATNKDLQCDL